MLLRVILLVVSFVVAGCTSAPFQPQLLQYQNTALYKEALVYVSPPEMFRNGRRSYSPDEKDRLVFEGVKSGLRTAGFSVTEEPASDYFYKVEYSYNIYFDVIHHTLSNLELSFIERTSGRVLLKLELPDQLSGLGGAVDIVNNTLSRSLPLKPGRPPNAETPRLADGANSRPAPMDQGASRTPPVGNRVPDVEAVRNGGNDQSGTTATPHETSIPYQHMKRVWEFYKSGKFDYAYFGFRDIQGAERDTFFSLSGIDRDAFEAGFAEWSLGRKKLWENLVLNYSSQVSNREKMWQQFRDFYNNPDRRYHGLYRMEVAHLDSYLWKVKVSGVMGGSEGIISSLYKGEDGNTRLLWFQILGIPPAFGKKPIEEGDNLLVLFHFSPRAIDPGNSSRSPVEIHSAVVLEYWNLGL